MTELASKYTPAEVEPQILQQWEQARAFAASPDDPGEPYCIVIPPPNVTAALHMGHALNNTVQDILIRYHRMRGRNTLWMPGTDHAGIATQTIVEKRVLQEEGKRRIDFQRDQFVEKIQSWKDEYEKVITNQLKTMGCSCDWDRQRFTMDDICARAVREAFFQLFKDGLIYRGKRLVNWDPMTQTALADDEVEMQAIDGHFWYMKYPLEDGSGHVTVATTRPETMLGDTAVAMHPKDPRADELVGKSVTLPIVNRIIPIIADDYVVLPDPEASDEKARYSSGFLKVTPAHDPNDWEIGRRFELPVINVMAPDASISKDHGWPAEEWDGNTVDPLAHQLLGMDRYEAREAIISWFREKDLLAEVKPYTHSVGHSYRSHVPIEPYLSDQWYVKVTDDKLAGAALRAMAQYSVPSPSTPGHGQGKSAPDNGGAASSESAPSPLAPSPQPSPRGRGGEDWEKKLRFFPERYARTFQNWHENIRDWCISRQLWWGHRIPVWTLRQDAGLPLGKQLQERMETLAQMVESKRVAVTVFGAPMSADRADWGLLFDLTEENDDDSIAVCVRDPEGEDAFIVELLEAAGFERDPDVLDTWFSSALWPISTMGWPDDSLQAETQGLLDTYNPGHVLCTAREIITLWVSRMVMFNLYFRNCLPFEHVFIHAMIQDGEGQKMSKSLGNGVDPLDIIHSHGSDAMRMTLAQMTTNTQDVRMPVDLICPHTGETFTPKMVKNKAGFRVAAPTQDCPTDGKKKMVTSYGLASGEAKVTDAMPLARNTSSKFDYGRNFANKLWNAVRFALSRLEDAARPADDANAPPARYTENPPFTLADRWILSRLARTVRETNDALAKYEFNVYAETLYDFIWRDFCDWYIEAIKPTVSGSAVQQRLLAVCIDASLRLLHPVMPFITEKLWERLNDVAPVREISGVSLQPAGLLVHARWPEVPPAMIDEPVERAFDFVREIVGAIRQVRTQYKVPPRQTVACSCQAPASTASTLLEHSALIATLCNIDPGEIGPKVDKPADAAVAVVGDAHVYLHGLIDSDTERQRLTKRIDELAKNVKALEGRLANKSYVEKAPEKLVNETREQLAAAKRELDSLEQQLGALA